MSPTCNVGWTWEFLEEKFSKAFVSKELRKHREDVLLDREKGLLPERLAKAEIEKKVREVQARIKVLNAEKKDLMERVREIQEQIRSEYANLHIIRETPSENRRQFVKACPNDDCRGFLSNRWICQLCDIAVCSECHEIKTEGHECKTENLETAKLISKDSKPCPSCGVFIYRIDGCSQMFCVACKTPFDWHTGRIVNGIIHNPEYYRWMRERGMEAPQNNGNCGLDNIWFFVRSFRVRNINFDLAKYHRSIQHIQQVEMPSYHLYNEVNSNEDLGVKYLLGDIDETSWKRNLVTRERKTEKNIEIRNILAMLVTAGSDILAKALDTNVTQEQADDVAKELEALRKYFNKSLRSLARKREIKAYVLDENWHYVQYVERT